MWPHNQYDNRESDYMAEWGGACAARTQGMKGRSASWDSLRCHHATQEGADLKQKLVISEIFHLIFSDHS